MKNFLKGLIVGGILVYIAMALSIDAQVNNPSTLRVPPISASGIWTTAQRKDLEAQWANFVTQQNQINETFTKRIAEAKD